MKDKYKKSQEYKYKKIENTKMSGKSSVLNILKSLFSNQAVIDGRKKPLYITIILALILIVITWIPPLSLGYTTKSASFLEGVNNNGIDHGFKMLFNEPYFQSIEVNSNDGEGIFSFDTNLLDLESSESATSVFDELEAFSNTKILGKGTFIDSKEVSDDVKNNTKWQVIKPNEKATSSFSDKSYVFYVDSLRSDKKQNLKNNVELAGEYLKDYTVYLEVYIIPDLKSTDDGFANIQSNFLSTVLFRLDDEKVPQKFPHSFMLVCKDCVRVVTYPINNVTKTMSSAGNFIGYTKHALKDASKKSLKSYLNGPGTKISDNDMYSSFVNFLNNTARHSNIVTGWIYVGIMSGSALLTFVVIGSLIFFMERRKTSIVKSTYVESLIQGVTICTTPALFSLFGFMSMPFGIIGLAGTALLRAVFMRNKISPPQANETQPLYKAKI